MENPVINSSVYNLIYEKGHSFQRRLHLNYSNTTVYLEKIKLEPLNFMKKSSWLKCLDMNTKQNSVRKYRDHI